MRDHIANTTRIDLLLHMADESETAKKLLRDAGFGVTGMGLLQTVKEALQTLKFADEIIRQYDSTRIIAAEREACATIADADLLGVPGGLVAAEHRWDNGSSDRTARRIAAAIRARSDP